MKTLSIVVVALVSLNACGGWEDDDSAAAAEQARQAQIEQTKSRFVGTWKMTISESGTLFDAQGRATPISATSTPSWVQFKDAGSGRVRFGDDDCSLVFRVDGDQLELDGSRTCESLEDSMKKETTYLSGTVSMNSGSEARISLSVTGSAESTNGGRLSWDAVAMGRLTK